MLSLIVNGTSRNIIVYDYEANPGVLSKRLIALMKLCSYNNKLKFNTLYICPSDLMPLVSCDDILDEYFDFEKISFYGYQIKLSSDLIDRGPAYSFYNSIGGCFPFNKNKLVVMANNDGQALLGAY